jgi:hypothetical protein
MLLGDSGVVVTYTVHGASAPPPTTTTTTTTTTTVPVAKPVPQPVVTHHPLPLTGAPVAVEMAVSFGLLLAGAIAAISARRRIPRASG